MNTTVKVHVDQRLLEEIQQEVKETIAVELELKKQKPSTFCAADLWNIHRQRKQTRRRSY